MHFIIIKVCMKFLKFSLINRLIKRVIGNTIYWQKHDSTNVNYISSNRNNSICQSGNLIKTSVLIVIVSQVYNNIPITRVEVYQNVQDSGIH